MCTQAQRVHNSTKKMWSTAHYYYTEINLLSYYKENYPSGQLCFHLFTWNNIYFATQFTENNMTTWYPNINTLYVHIAWTHCQHKYKRQALTKISAQPGMWESTNPFSGSCPVNMASRYIFVALWCFWLMIQCTLTACNIVKRNRLVSSF